MYHAKKIGVLVGDRATVAVFEIKSLMSGDVRFQLMHEKFADAENPTGVRIMNDRGYALTLAAGLAQEGRIG